MYDSILELDLLSKLVAANYSKRFARTSRLCVCKEARDEENHLPSRKWEVYGDLTYSFRNLKDDNNLVKFSPTRPLWVKLV